jgi:hypothetical protein
VDSIWFVCGSHNPILAKYGRNIKSFLIVKCPN